MEKVNENMNEIGNRPFYYADLYVDPQNENRVYSIFTYVNVSEDGGKSLKLIQPMGFQIAFTPIIMPGGFIQTMETL